MLVDSSADIHLEEGVFLHDSDFELGHMSDLANGNISACDMLEGFKCACTV